MNKKESLVKKLRKSQMEATAAEGKNMALPDGAMPGRSVRNIARSRTPRTSC